MSSDDQLPSYETIVPVVTRAYAAAELGRSASRTAKCAPLLERKKYAAGFGNPFWVTKRMLRVRSFEEAYAAAHGKPDAIGKKEEVGLHVTD